MQMDIKETLLEARKAYRFLYEYQRRILDLADFIGKKYDYTYQGGYSKFSNVTPRDGKGHLNNWAWDWLNMYYYEFHFNTRKVGNDEIHFSIFVLNDTGFFQAKEEKEKADEKYTNTFEDVESSESKLIFVVGKNLWASANSFTKNNWSTTEFVLEETGIYQEDESKLMLFKSYSLEKFYDEESTLGCIKDFQNYCKQYEVQLDIKEKVGK